MTRKHVGPWLHSLVRFLESRQPPAADDLLLERFVRSGDEEAFACLMRRYGPLVLGVARRVLGHEQDAEDVAQATFLVLARRASAIRKRAALGSWLYGVAYRLARKARTALARRGQKEHLSPPATAPEPEADLTWRELRAVLDEELARLPDRLRAPLLLCYFEGQTQDETARQLGWKKRTVKARLEQGRRRLRGRLARRGLDLSAGLAGAWLPAGTASAVTPRLIESTAQAARLFAARQALDGTVSASAAALAEGGLQAMAMGKTKLIVACVFLTVALASGSGLLLSQLGSHPPAAAPAVAPARTDLYGDPLPPGARLRLGTVRFRHDGHKIEGLAFLPDSRTIIGAHYENVLQFWDATTGRRLREISSGPVDIRAFALSPDGKLIAVAGLMQHEGKNPCPCAVRVLQTASGKEVRTFAREAHDVYSCSLLFTPDSKLLASLGENKVLRIEEISSGVELFRHQFARDVQPHLALSPDGSTLAVAGEGDSPKLYVWQWQSGEEPREIHVLRHAVGRLAFSPDGRNLAAVSDRAGMVRIWDVKAGRLRQQHTAPELGKAWSSHVVYSRDGKTLAVGSSGSRFAVVNCWDATTGDYRGKMEIGGRPLAISPDSRLLVASFEYGIRVWDLVAGKEIAANEEAHRATPGLVAVTPDGTVVTAGDDHTIRVWDGTTGRQKNKMAHDSWVRAIAVSPDGARLASSSFDDTVRLWDLATGREIYRLPGHGEVGGHRALGFTPDGKRFLSWGDDFYLRVWDATTGKALREHRIRPSGVAVPDEDDVLGRQMEDYASFKAGFTPDGQRLVLALGKHLYVFRVETGDEVKKIERERSWVGSLAFSPDGKLLAVTAWGEPVKTKVTNGEAQSPKRHWVSCYDLDSGKKVRCFQLPGQIGSPVAFSPEGRILAARAEVPHGHIRFWEIATGKELPPLPADIARVWAMTYSPDGRWLVTGLQDTTALIWDVTNKR